MRLKSLLITTAMLFVGASALADDEADKTEIKTKFEAIASTFVTGPADAVGKAAAGGFQFMDILGRQGPAGTWADRAKWLYGKAKEATVVTTVESFASKDAVKVVYLRTKATGKITDAVTASEVAMEQTTIFRTEWTKEGDGFKMKSAREVFVDGTINRRPRPFYTSPEEQEAMTGFVPLYGGLAELYQKQEFADAEKAVTDAFEIYDMDGVKLTKKELFDRIKAGGKIVSNPIASLTPRHISMDGDKVYIVRKMQLFGDVTLPDGKMGRLLYVQVTRDTYQKLEKTYKPLGTTELWAEASVNNVRIPLSIIAGKK